jgi:hypothetical protein
MGSHQFTVKSAVFPNYEDVTFVDKVGGSREAQEALGNNIARNKVFVATENLDALESDLQSKGFCPVLDKDSMSTQPASYLREKNNGQEGIYLYMADLNTLAPQITRAMVLERGIGSSTGEAITVTVNI